MVIILLLCICIYISISLCQLTPDKNNALSISEYEIKCDWGIKTYKIYIIKLKNIFN